jgi:DNA-binding response OmpR family regulator
MRRVLLVPDRVMEGELRASYLDRGSLSIRTAHDAAEALSMAQQLRPDLVVLRGDFVLDAQKLCASLRDLLPKMQLLLLTDFVGKSDPDAFEGLYDARLVQPVDAPQLLATVACLLEIRTRRGPRARLDSLVHMAGFGVEPQGAASVANAIDVSEHGMLVEASEQLGMGMRGTVRFFLPDNGAAVVAIGTVCVAMDEVLLHYAINFDEIDAVARESLARYVTGQSA